MLFAGTTLSVINLVLCIIIFVMGFSGYRKDKNKLRLYIAFAFALFGISHFVTILDIETIAVLNFLIIIRTIAYLSVVFALCKASSK